MPPKSLAVPLPFRNQIVLSKSAPTVNLEGFSSTQIGSLHLQYSTNLPIISASNALFIGWAWNCTSGNSVDQEFVDSLDAENVVEQCNPVSGRYIIIFENDFLFTDATSSFGIYFDKNTVSTSLTLFCKVTNRQLSDQERSNRQIIPPLTAVEGVRKLIVGQYLSLGGDNRAISIENFLQSSDRFQSLDDQIEKISDHLTGCARGLVDAVDNNFRLTFTSGKDSRLSFLSLYQVLGKSVRTVTNKKRFYLDNPSDIQISKLIASRLGTDHISVSPKLNDPSVNMSLYEQHCFFLSGIRNEGSPYSYYRNGNLAQIKAEHLIYNYYESGRMHLIGKKWIDCENGVSFENLSQYFVLSEECFNDLLAHMKIVSPDGDLKDSFYLLKHYSGVSDVFEQLDFTHSPMIFCNSRFLLANLLNVPPEFRRKGVFHKRLLSHLTPSEIADVDCNPNEERILFKIRRRLVDKIGNTLQRILVPN